jgi:non-lysosomal glucosylceramidase
VRATPRNLFAKSISGWLPNLLLIPGISLAIVPTGWAAAPEIPAAAWSRPLGQPLPDHGKAIQPDQIDDGIWQGAPVGGFGAGTFLRSFRGDFVRWHIEPGVDKYATVDANQFAMFQQSDGDASGFAQVLMSGHPRGRQLSSWRWDYPVGAGDYRALYPKSWYDYRMHSFPAHVVLEQFSPILPDNYKETSFPVAVYRWHANNPTNRAVHISILLSWTNMDGWFRGTGQTFKDASSTGNFDRFASEPLGSGTMKGIVFDRERAGTAPSSSSGQFAIAALEVPGVTVDYQTTFQADGDGKGVWQSFAKDGSLPDDSTSWVSASEKLAGAITIRFTLQPGESKTIPMVIAWDFPNVQFGLGRVWNRRYTDFYGSDGNQAWPIARDGLLHADDWSSAIDRWQAPWIGDASKPLWLRGMLFNELYELADGSSFWGRQSGEDLQAPAHFASLECFDYAYYGTLDVRFYSSLPLLKFWPQIEKQELRDFAATVPREYPQQGLWVWKSQQLDKPVLHLRKRSGAVPHDLGVPSGDPFILVNEPGWQDTNNWKDLNSKFVLMAWRDYALTGSRDRDFLRDMWPAMQQAITYLSQFNGPGGVPENSGYPDQTYDSWVVTGVSAYSGNLWLGALRAAEETAHVLDDSEAEATYHAMFLKAQKTYIAALWTGRYFRYEASGSSRDGIQADQLAGQWYANMTGLGDLIPHSMQVATLRQIYSFNVLKFGGGVIGAANGMKPDGTVVNNEQAREVWVGTTSSLAALMLQENMTDQAWKTAWGLYHVIYQSRGYWFRTPEAWDVHGNFRASMYMRPMAIWALVVTQPSTQ